MPASLASEPAELASKLWLAGGENMVGKPQGEEPKETGQIYFKAPDRIEIILVGPNGKFNLANDALLGLPPDKIGSDLRRLRVMHLRSLLRAAGGHVEVNYLDECDMLMGKRTLHDVILTMAHEDGSFDIEWRDETFEDATPCGAAEVHFSGG
jgi:hypothetical protein